MEQVADTLPRFLSGVEVHSSLLLSMELFASSRFEASTQGRFIALVSALEPLASPQDLPQSMVQFIDGIVEQAKRQDFDTEGPASGRDSLLGRLQLLRKESIRTALLRTVRGAIPDEHVAKLIDHAYGMRSRILHHGHHEPYLDALIRHSENAVRMVYSGMLGLELSAPCDSNEIETFLAART